MKILCFGATSARNSINKKLARYTAEKFDGATIEEVDLNDFELPLYSVDKETTNGIVPEAKVFFEKIQNADLIIVSFAEHNGTYTAVFKNLFDWISRINYKCFEAKKMLLLSTSLGPRGGATVLGTAKIEFPFHGAEVLSTFSLPSFSENFSENSGIAEPFVSAFNQFIEEAKSKI